LRPDDPMAQADAVANPCLYKLLAAIAQPLTTVDVAQLAAAKGQLEDALAAAKTQGSGVAPSVIAKAEAKLYQANQRLQATQNVAVRQDADKELRAVLKQEVPFDLGRLRTAIEKAEELKIGVHDVNDAWAMLTRLQLEVAAQQAVGGWGELEKALKGFLRVHGAAAVDVLSKALISAKAVDETTSPERSRIPQPRRAVTAGTLQQQVTAWHASNVASQGSPDERRQKIDGYLLHKKFEASGNTFTFAYGPTTEFYGGLEALVGCPSADVMAAMELDHASDELFEAQNADKWRSTTPRAEWVYVVDGVAGEAVGFLAEGRERAPSHVADKTDRAGWKLQDFASQPTIKQAGLMIAEVAGIRLYTGPMYVLYNAVLRGLRTDSSKLQEDMIRLCCPKHTADRYLGNEALNIAPGSVTLEEAMLSLNRYPTTIHAINSGIVKLSKLTEATTVYRGVYGLLPDEFWKKKMGVMGGVDRAFMSTSTEREVAIGYVKQSNKVQKILFEIRMGMIDRGADVSCLSQFPAEKEILFAPLTGLEVASVPRDEDGVLVVELRLSCNLHNLTLEQVVAKMQTSHVALIDTMIDDLRLGIAGLPRAVLTPLEEAKAHALQHDRKYFSKPHQYLQATREALDANDKCYAELTTHNAWPAADADRGAVVAACMRQAAQKCAQEGRSTEAAALLVMAVTRSGVGEEHTQKVNQVLEVGRKSAAERRPALEAASVLLATHGLDALWQPTMVELGTRSGDRHTVGELAKLYGHEPSILWRQPLAEYPDLPFTHYKTQPHFQQINTNIPGLQLIHAEPYIFACKDFLTAEECRTLINEFSLSADKASSARFEAQTKDRTSTTVVFGGEGETKLLWLRERIAKLARVSTEQLQVPKITRYEKGEFFRKHVDALHDAKWPWVQRLVAANETAEQLTGPGETCWYDDRICTVWIYLNDVSTGGCTRWQTSDADAYSDVLFESMLPQMGRILGKAVPDVPTTRSNGTVDFSVRPKAGMAVVHFPATVKEYMCLADLMTYHESEVAVDPKYIMQQFIWADTREAVLEKNMSIARERNKHLPEEALEERLKKMQEHDRNLMYGSQA